MVVIQQAAQPLAALDRARGSAGFSPTQQNAAGTLMSGSAQLNGSDTSKGTNTSGVVQDNYNNTGIETASYSYLTTTDTTPSPDQAFYQQAVWRSMANLATETGSYTTSNLPAGSPGFIMPGPGNPGGYAKFSQTHDDNVSVSNTVSLGEAGYGILGYTGTAMFSTTSNHTSTADVANNVHTESGSYSTFGHKMELSGLSGGGTEGGPAYGMSWKFSDFWNNGKTVQDSGTYPGGGNATESSGSAQGWTETDNYWGVSPAPAGAWGYTSTSSGDSSIGGSTTGADGVAGQDQGADAGDAAPAEALTGDDAPYTVQSAPYDASPYVGGSAWDGYWWNVLLTAKGYFIDEPWAIVKGLGTMALNEALNPGSTALGLAHAVLNPRETWNGVKAHYSGLAKTPEGQGAIAFEVALTAVTLGDAAVGLAGKTNILGRGAAVAGEGAGLGSGLSAANSASRARYLIPNRIVQEEVAGYIARNTRLLEQNGGRIIELSDQLGPVVDGARSLARTNFKDKVIYLFKGATQQDLIEELLHFRQALKEGVWGGVADKALIAAWEKAVDTLFGNLGMILAQ